MEKKNQKKGMLYPPQMPEEELKNRVAKEFFGDFDCTYILGNVDFCAAVPAGELPGFPAQSVLWAEAKKGERDPVESFIQLILTLGKERTFDKYLPPKYIAAFDCRKIAFLLYFEIMEVFSQNDFNWNVTPSDHSTKEFKELQARLSGYMQNHAMVFEWEKDGKALRSFIKQNIKISDAETSLVEITRNNFTHIYGRWREEVLPTIAFNDWEKAKQVGIIDADFFLADIFSLNNASLNDKLNVLLQNDHYKQMLGKDMFGDEIFKDIGFKDKQKAHKLFWNKWKRPPREEYWDYIVNRRDLLVPQDVRERKGSFFTPRQWVELSQHYLALELGENWQDEYTIWDCCAGTGNLLAGLVDKYKIWASTLDQADVDAMQQRIAFGANLLPSHVFQFDFLNDSFDKLPDGLREIVNDPEKRKKLVIYINPPYAEAASAKTVTGTGTAKAGVATGHGIHGKYKPMIGSAANELFALFFIRIYSELRNCRLGEFSKLKILQAGNFAIFRQVFRAKLGHCFCVPANTFDNVNGQFPIGFFVWNTEKIDTFVETDIDVYDSSCHFIGAKMISSNDTSLFINNWYSRFYDKTGVCIGIMHTRGNDFQNHNYIRISSEDNHNHTNHITSKNLIPTCIYFAVRHCIQATWLNDRDQFLYPNDNTLRIDTEFHGNCIAYTLFSNQNFIIASGINHWIPFTEAEVDAKDTFKSHFMTDFLQGKLSVPEDEETLPGFGTDYAPPPTEIAAVA